MGIKAYPSIAAIPETVDLAIIATPASTVPGIISECVDAGVQGVIIISAGFKEAGAEGIALERQILEEARRGNIRIISQLLGCDESPHWTKCNLRQFNGAFWKRGFS